MEIRPLRESDDRLEVSRIYEESWKFAYRGIIPQAYLDTIPIGRWAANRDLEGSLVLEEGGQLIGTARTGPSRWPKYPDSGEIVSLYLLPEFTGRGYGRPLLAAAVGTLADQGYRDVLLWTLEENRRARRFYEKAGFVSTGDFMDNIIGGRPLREVLYRRPRTASPLKLELSQTGDRIKSRRLCEEQNFSEGKCSNFK